VATVARELNVKPEEVVEMETRLTGGDVALEPQTDDGEESYAPIAYLADDSSEPTRRWKPATATGWPATASAARWPRWTSAAAASSRSAG
jgi:hypothetical protein